MLSYGINSFGRSLTTKPHYLGPYIQLSFPSLCCCFVCCEGRERESDTSGCGASWGLLWYSSMLTCSHTCPYSDYIDLVVSWSYIFATGGPRCRTNQTKGDAGNGKDGYLVSACKARALSHWAILWFSWITMLGRSRSKFCKTLLSFILGIYMRLELLEHMFEVYSSTSATQRY